MMMGMSEMFLLTIVFGGAGIPLGVPPGPEDAHLAKIAPDECLYYSSWAGMVTPDANSGNSTEKLLAEPEVQQFIQFATKTFKDSVLKLAADGNAPPPARLAATVVPELIVGVLSSPTAIFVEDFNVAPGGVTAKAAVISKVGKKAEVLAAKLEQLQQFAIPDAPKVTIDGTEYFRISPGRGAPTIHWGRKGDYIMLTVGDGVLESMAKRAKTDAPAWLTKIAKRLPVERRASVSYVDLKQIITKATAFAPAEVNGILKKLGVGEFTTIATVTGLDKKGFVSRSILGTTGKQTGVFKAFASEPLELEDLANIPSDATIAAAFKLDLGKLYDTSMELVRSIAPNEANEIVSGLTEGEQALGFKLRDDLLGSIGDVWQLHTSAANGGLIAGWTASVSLRNTDKLKGIVDKLVGLAQGQGGRRGPKIRKLKAGRDTIHYIVIPDDDFIISPAWCISNDRLHVALFPQVLKGYLKAPKESESLAANPSIKALFGDEKQPTFVAYQDTRQLFRIAYPAMQYALTSFSGNAARAGLEIDAAILPSPATIDKHMHPGVVAAYQTEDGYETLIRQSVPGSNVVATLPITAAFMLPAISVRRIEARAVGSANNLKQMGLAFHMLHDQRKSLPAAYSTDANGKKLLSWRVHILPFIEQENLYRQFKLDEAWDSPHNKKLIAKMPAIYRTPGSRVGAGKTTYLGIGGKDALLTKPKVNGQKVPLGVSFRNVTDGLSQTLAIAEVTDKKAVTWTKPDDIDASSDKAFDGVLRLKDGRVLVLLGDGSVMRLKYDENKKQLKAMATRAGDEVVRIER